MTPTRTAHTTTLAAECRCVCERFAHADDYGHTCQGCPAHPHTKGATVPERQTRAAHVAAAYAHRYPQTVAAGKAADIAHTAGAAAAAAAYEVHAKAAKAAARAATKATKAAAAAAARPALFELDGPTDYHGRPLAASVDKTPGVSAEALAFQAYLDSPAFGDCAAAAKATDDAARAARHPEAVSLDDDAPVDPVLIVIPCGGTKLDHAAPAGELYTGAGHRLSREAADALAVELASYTHPARVVILSALHGLVELHDVVEPYDLLAGDPGTVTAYQLADQLAELHPAEIVALTPKRYSALLTAGAGELGRGLVVVDVLAGSRGLLDQRATLARIKRGDFSPITDTATR